MVYIDMKMPKNCKSCSFCNFRGYNKTNLCRLLDEIFTINRGRYEYCPLKETKNDK